MRKIIAIIGVGNIGTRHLQSMQYLEMEYEIYAYDPSKDSIEKCRKMCASIWDNTKRQINYINDIQQLPYYIDLVIVATSANVRRGVIEQLINRFKIKFLVLEKVLFQKKEDFFSVKELLEKNNIMAWVNTPRRAFNSYRHLKEDMRDINEFEVYICGTNWGMGCNLIHYIDSISFLADDEPVYILDIQSDEVIPENKRKGFYELNGTVIGSIGKCNYFRITSYRESEIKSPATIYIQSEKLRCIIIEDERKIIKIEKEDEWKITEQRFEMPYISEFSYRVVEDILKYGRCNLPSYELSMQEHLPMIEKLIECHFQKLGIGGDICPIT